MKESAPGGSLAGHRIVVTRQDAQSGGVSAALRALGATVVELPAIEVLPPEDPGPLDEALRELERYEWMAFTSANAVEAVAAGLVRVGRAGLPAALKLASVGPATSRAVESAIPGATIALEPAASDFRAEGLLRAFAEEPLSAVRVVLPLSDRARPELANGLRALGARVDAVVAYRTEAAADLPGRLAAAMALPVDLLLFASPSAVSAVAAVLGQATAELPAVVIGPTTAEAARAAGFAVRAVAPESSVAGLVRAVVEVLV